MTKHVSPPVPDLFRSSILAGLCAEPKTISAKWLYDDVGSHLFEAITELEVYYPTRTEIGILRQNAGKYARLPGARGVLLELGSGSSRKTDLLLSALVDLSVYMPVDISGNHLKAAADRVRQAWPSLAVIPVTADFTQPLSQLPLLPELPVLIFFPGSTIGNFNRPEAVALLRSVAASVPGATLLIGVDRPKAANRLVAAYDDPAGVTAAFNKNLLARINRELGANFDLGAFRHRAIWNPDASRIEMHLESLTEQQVAIDGATVGFRAGETIHTENSHKYSSEAFAGIAADAGWRVLCEDRDPDGLFSVYTLATG